MHSMLHRSLLCLALVYPLFAQAQTTVDQTVTTPSAPATLEEPAAADAAAVIETEGNAVVAEKEGKIGVPPEGKGQIVFFREKKFAGAAIKYKVREGEVELGKLSSGTYFVHTADPGAHVYTVHSEAKDILNLEVEPGETYYVIGAVTMGFLAGRPNLSPSDETAYAGMAAKLKPAKPLVHK